MKEELEAPPPEGSVEAELERLMDEDDDAAAMEAAEHMGLREDE